MEDFRPRRAAATDNREPSKRPSRLAERPDRVALWAVVLAVTAMIAGAASAQAGSSGGIGGGSGSSGGATQTSSTGAGGEAATLKWVRQRATWYGPGFFGNETACGKRLTRTTIGVAHKTLPCGAKVVIRYGGRYLRTTVVDRGPYANKAKWDLTQAAARSLGFEHTDEIRVARPR